jgi:hypothetical protein
MKLYKSAIHPGRWVAYVPGRGWVAFPAREHGWEERVPARGLDPVHLREVPLSMAEATGILATETADDDQLVGAR